MNDAATTDAIADATGTAAIVPPEHQVARVIGGTPAMWSPLSAFSLFYEFKHRKLNEFILTCRAEGRFIDKAEFEHIVTVNPGREFPHDFIGIVGSAEETRGRQAMIRNELADNLLPSDTRDRQHRSNVDQHAFNGIVVSRERHFMICNELAEIIINPTKEVLATCKW